MSGLVPEMDQGIRAALRIQWRTTGFDEAHAQVEAYGLRILCVDVGAQLRVQRQCVLQQLPADTSAAHVGIDEQRFHVAAVDQHEALWLVPCIDSDGHRRLRQEACHFGIDGLAVFGTEKVVGGVDGATPECDEGGAIVITSSSAGLKVGGTRFSTMSHGAAGYAAAFASRLERHALADPYQWFNFFDFWARPEGNPPS